MRVTTALNRLLALRDARVSGCRLTGEGVVVTVRLRRRRLACSCCGQVYRGMYDRALRRWRHLDLAGRRCFIEYELRRVDCRDCGVRVEAVPWARTGARHTRDFEDLTAFCAQQMAKSQVQALLRVAWDTVGRIVADHLDESRLAGLVQIGCDELSYRRGQRYLTNVADHRSGRIVWSSPGRNAETLQEFFDLLGERLGGAWAGPLVRVEVERLTPPALAGELDDQARAAACRGRRAARGRDAARRSRRWPVHRRSRCAAPGSLPRPSAICARRHTTAPGQSGLWCAVRVRA
jgi:hypothetical protein